MNSCKNCAADFEGNFCNNCGQKLITKRFTFWDSVGWLFGSIFNFDKGFPYTTKELILRPGEVIKGFLNGNTIRYAHPFRFVFIWATLSALIGVYLDVYEESGLAVNRMAGQTEEQLERSRKIMVYMKQYMSFVMMGIIPFSAFGTYLVTKRKGLNYTEHLIMIAYGNGSSMVIGLPVLLAYLLIDDTGVLGIISLVMGFVVMGRVLAQTIDDNMVIGILKYTLSFIVGFICMMITMTLLTIVVLLVMKQMGLPNPFAEP